MRYPEKHFIEDISAATHQVLVKIYTTKKSTFLLEAVSGMKQYGHCLVWQEDSGAVALSGILRKRTID